MKVEVQLFATLAQFLPPRSEHGRAVVDVPDGGTVGDVADALGIPAAMPRIALVNGEDADDGRRLAPGDVVTLFPPLAGGA